MDMDFSDPPPQAKTLEEAQEIINVLWKICGDFSNRIKQLEEENTQLKQRLSDVEEKLNTNSRNSSNPPSSDKNKAKADRRKKKKRKQGGQAGHKGTHRALLPTTEVDAVQAI